MRNFCKNKIFYVFILLFTCLLFSCSDSGSTNKPPELIEFHKIEAGKSDTVYVSELFFKKSYNLTFLPSDHVEALYDKDKNQLIMIPDKNFEGLTFVNFQSEGTDLVIPVIIKKKPNVVFEYKPKKKVKNIYVMGNFNNWNRSGDEMFDEDDDGIYSTTISLDDGVYEYQFVADKNEFPDPNNPEKVDNGFGSFNSLKRVRSASKDFAPHLYFLPMKEDDKLNFAIENGKINQDFKLYVLLNNKVYPQKFYEFNQSIAEISLFPLKKLDGVHSLRIVATVNDIPGNVLTLWLKEGKPLSSENNVLWQDAIIYSLMIDRFANGNPENDRPVNHPELDAMANFLGGDFAGITNKIKQGYFDSLGVNTLWISPVNKTTDQAYKEWPEPHRYYTGYHGYWPVSARESEPRFGSNAELKELVNTAHKHNIKVLIDFISNHTHKEHEYFTNNPHWFGQVDLPNGEKNIRRWDEYRLTTWFDTFLPSFDFENNHEAIEKVTDDAIWWLENYHFDGFRHDATKHVPYTFWKSLTKKIKTKVNPIRDQNIYQIGETFGGHDLIKSYVNSSMLDAQFNFNQFFIARRIFSDDNSDFHDLSSAIDKALEIYGYNHLMGNIMDSHDQVRMMALFDGDITLSENAVERAFKKPRIKVDHVSSYKKQFVYYTYMMTVPGIPIIYFGDEYGGTGAGDPDNRRMMRFEKDLKDVEKKQLEKVSKLIFLRKEHSSLRRGDYKMLAVTNETMLFTRGDINERLLIGLNKSDEEQKILFNLPKWMNAKTMVSLLDDSKFKINEKLVELTIPPYSSNIWQMVNQ